MNIDEYKSIQKKAEKVYQTCLANGEEPYLPVMEEVTQDITITGRQNLGIISVPIDHIIGTENSGRSNAFANGFLPLLAPDTEFAMKWINLYNSMEEEGLRDPIIASEYMGYYYVREGNKRVSVAKLLGLPYIEANVTRLIPQRTDDFENKLYFEYLDFYNESHINNIHFTKLGSYQKFMEMVNPSGEPWSDDLKLDVTSLINRFRKEYHASTVRKVGVNSSDALLVYVSLMGFEYTKDLTPSEIRADLPELKAEFELEVVDEPVSISAEPTAATPKQNIFTSLFKGTKKLKIAFMYRGNIENSAWAYSHDLGRHYVEEVAFKDEISIDSFFDVSDEEAEFKLEELCHQGYDIIFAVAPQHNAACSKVAILHPEVKILNCSLNLSTGHVRTYYLRTYEIKYLLGMIAGAITRTNKIAYVCDYPVYGSVASINAFAIGAKTVNPCAEVYLSWTSVKNSNPDYEIALAGCDVVSNLDWSSPKNLTSKYGLYLNEFDENDRPIHLAAPLLDWGKLYESIIKGVQSGSWKLEEQANKGQSLSYWWGLSSQAVDMIFSHNMPEFTQNLVLFLKSRIISGEFHPLYGTLTYQDGTSEVIDSQDSLLSISHMSKLVDNVHGFVPTTNDITEDYAGLTKVIGVKKED